jgi:hypothetical protein
MNINIKKDDPEFPVDWNVLLFGRNQVLQFYATYSM